MQQKAKGVTKPLVMAPVPRPPQENVKRSDENSVCARSSAGLICCEVALILKMLAVVVQLRVVRQTCHYTCFCYVSAAMSASHTIGASCYVVLGVRRMTLF